MKAIVLFSGGVDSTICLALAIKKYGKENILAVNINYGQKNKKELSCAKNLAKYYDVNYELINISNIFRNNKNCSMLNGNKEIPKITYEEQVKNNQDKPVSTNVPFRNGLMLSVCTALAIDNNCEVIYYGIHLENGIAAKLYPDCGERFNKEINKVIKTATKNEVRIYAPLVKLLKPDVLKIGLKLKVPFEKTWTCYEDKNVACGKCTACRDRINGFNDIGKKDPLKYCEE